MERTPEQVERLKKWVKALKSGKYEQGQGALRIQHLHDPKKAAFCCLGVACDLFTPDRWGTVAGNGFTEHITHDGEQKVDTPVVEEMQEWFGLNNSDPQVWIEDRLMSLATLNDDGASFEDIADVIQKNFIEKGLDGTEDSIMRYRYAD